MEKQPPPKPEILENDPYKHFGVIEDVGAETRAQLFKGSSKKQFQVFMAISAAWMLFWGWQLLQKLQAAPTSGNKWYFFALCLPILIFTILYANFKNAILELFVRQFAKENNFSYLASMKNITDENAALFNLGHGKRLTHLIGGKLNGHEVKLFYYNYTVGHGKQSHLYQSTVIRITNDHIVPPILLVADNQHFGGIKPAFEDSVKIKPEIDFDAEFDLYTKRKFEIEALQVFTPGLMEIMLKRWKIFNIDFSGNEIYIFANKQIGEKLTLQNMLALGKYILENVDPQLQKMQKGILNLHALNPNNK